MNQPAGSTAQYRCHETACAAAAKKSRFSALPLQPAAGPGGTDEEAAGEPEFPAVGSGVIGGSVDGAPVGVAGPPVGAAEGGGEGTADGATDGAGDAPAGCPLDGAAARPLGRATGVAGTRDVAPDATAEAAAELVDGDTLDPHAAIARARATSAPVRTTPAGRGFTGGE